MVDKAKRLWIPTLVVHHILFPMAIIMGQATASEQVLYFATPGPAWFLLWLLMLNWVFVFRVRPLAT